MGVKKLFYDISELEEVISLSRKNLYEVIKQDDFPKPVNLTPKKRLWKVKEIEEWAEKKR